MNGTVLGDGIAARGFGHVWSFETACAGSSARSPFSSRFLKEHILAQPCRFTLYSFLKLFIIVLPSGNENKKKQI